MNKPELLSLDLALEKILLLSKTTHEVETVSTFDADRRVLAEDVHSEIQVPGFDNSAMDGYAFRYADFLQHQGMLQAGQRIPAGHFPEPLVHGMRTEYSPVHQCLKALTPLSCKRNVKFRLMAEFMFDLNPNWGNVFGTKARTSPCMPAYFPKVNCSTPQLLAWLPASVAHH